MSGGAGFRRRPAASSRPETGPAGEPGEACFEGDLERGRLEPAGADALDAGRGRAQNLADRATPSGCAFRSASTGRDQVSGVQSARVIEITASPAPPGTLRSTTSRRRSVRRISRQPTEEKVDGL